MMFSSDSPPKDNNGSLHTSCEEEMLEEMEKEPSSYDCADFK